MTLGAFSKDPRLGAGRRVPGPPETMVAGGVAGCQYACAAHMKPLFLSGTALVPDVGCVQGKCSQDVHYDKTCRCNTCVHVSLSRAPGSCECESSHDGVSIHGDAAPQAGGLLLPLHPAADRPLRHGHKRRVRVQVKTSKPGRPTVKVNLNASLVCYRAGCADVLASMVQS